MKIGRRFDIAQQQYSLLYPGTFTRTSLEMTKMNLIKGKGQNCVDSKIGQMRMQILNTTYSPGACRMDCVRQVGIKECGCHMPLDRRFLKNPKIQYCTPKQFSECVYPAIYAQNDTIYNCAIHCRTPCTLYRYRADTNSARFPTFKFREANLNAVDRAPPPPPLIVLPPVFEFPGHSTTEPPTSSAASNSSSIPTSSTQTSSFSSSSQWDFPTPYNFPTPSASASDNLSFQNDYYNNYWVSQEDNKLEEAKEKVAELQQEDHIILDVSYSAMQYIEITQEPSMTATTFISNIGGQVGLWVGASNITIIKFFIILVPLMLSVVGGGRQPNENL